jgi:hypothetical protein
MATGNTTISAFSSHHSHESLAMIVNAAPAGITALAERRDDLPHFILTIDELDEIVEGKNADAMESSFPGGSYLLDVLPALDWWVECTKALSLGKSTDWIDFHPVFEREKSKLIELLNDALSSYAAALAEASFYSDTKFGQAAPAGLELLRKYRLYTRHVCAVAREMWPDVNLDWLLKQA